MATLGVPVHADWKITTVMRFQDGQSVQTEYFKGGLKRVDEVNDVNGGHHEAITVLDMNRLRQTVWNTNLQEYMVARMRRGIPLPPTGPEIVIERATVDTGERKNLFGRVARHLVTHERRRNAGAIGLADSETEIDGWYVDSDLLPREKRGTAFHVLVAGNARPSFKVNQTGPAPSGLAVWKSEISRSVLPNGSRAVNERTIEVTELIEALLPDEIFNPPAGFKRVLSFSGDRQPDWTDGFRLEWERFEDWISSIFG